MKLIIHGGAGADSQFLRQHQREYYDTLQDIICKGYQLLMQGDSAIDVVKETVAMLEDIYLFNAGRGSALNSDGNVEMDAAIMDGKTSSAGAVALVTKALNPIRLADAVRSHTPHMLLGGVGADLFAVEQGLATEDCAYFVVPHQKELWQEQKASMEINNQLKGTVGAVAVDGNGDIAAATSTGGITGKRIGRIGDSCIIGAGCYADNRSCAVSGTGDGEILMGELIAYQVANTFQATDLDLQDVCESVVMNVEKSKGDVGLIAVSSDGQMGVAFNSERMIRAWMDESKKPHIAIYQDPLS
ncbi:hypothetical protein AAW12_18850 [Sphingobacterium sp. Ag1]|uniref:isoaspartyl peptidase/L-asparaginase family protein n=1 Tax=Sphingobacterium sp. Ag1 TaxID=1643451 RepID=UPI000627661D|nr:isoaspartyl peptidase/L-asparaginase [Sphingobacterium sp. Ag1]KKO89671.1 hypothetical protein AAW12_18850 [Sphingobacterium sp. Ag1]